MALPQRHNDFEPETELNEPNYWKPEAIEGGGEGDGKPQGKLRAVKDGEELPDLKELEENPPEEASEETQQLKPKGKNKLFNTVRKKLVWAGVVGLISIAFSILFFFLPALRLESYLARINQRAFAGAATAMELRIQHLAERYMLLHILSLNNCVAVSSIDCRADYDGQGIAARLFTTWRDVKIEEKLFNNLGFSVESTRNPDSRAGVHRLTIKDRGGRTITFSGISDWDNFKSGHFTGGSRQFGREVNRIMRKETKWYQVMERHSIRKYLTRKHGARFWCFFACKTLDNVEIRTADAKTRFKYRFIERFVYPFSGKFGLYLDCLYSGTSSGRCSPEQLRRNGIDRARISDEEAKKLIDHIRNNPNKRLGQIALEELFEKIFQRQLSQRAVAAIPVVGWTYLGFYAFNAIDNVDSYIENNGLSKLVADLNTRQYIEYYAAMRSVNDELKAGELSFGEIGVIMAEFEGAESSQVYQAYDTRIPPTLAWFGGKAYAQNQAAPENADSGSYVCKNGKPIPAGELVCPEKKLSKTFAIEDWRNSGGVLASISDGVFTAYRCCGLKLLVSSTISVVDTISETVLGPIVSLILNGAKFIPGVSQAVNFISDKGQDLIFAILDAIAPLPVQIDSPGREKYDALEAGADISATEFAKGGVTESGEAYGLGAPRIDDTEVAKLHQEHLSQEAYEFETADLITRLFDIDQPRSLITSVVPVIPMDTASFSQFLPNIASLLVGTLTNIFASLTATPAAAQSYPQQTAINAFGITRHGYTLDSPALTMDPAQLTEDYCAEAEEHWVASMKENELTGIDEYSTANPCLLEQAVAESAGLFFTND